MPAKSSMNDSLLSHIYYRKCFKFCPQKEKPNQCRCNRPRNHHEDEDDDESKDSWTIDHNTRRYPSYYGFLTNNAMFLRLEPDTSIARVKSFLLEIAGLKQPKLILSIIGGAKYFKLDDRLELAVFNTIIQLAIRTDSWLITNGYKVGITQLVGNAIRKAKSMEPDREVVALAVCKWGSVKDVEELIISTVPEQSKKSHDSAKSAQNNDDRAIRHGECDLEMNHSHYLMVDDGTVLKYDIEDFRTRLCNYIRRTAEKENSYTHAATIVVEGGFDTFNNIYSDLKHNIPVIIVNGSGRVADLFSRWLTYVENMEYEPKDFHTVYEIDECASAGRPLEIRSVKSEQISTNRTDVRAELHVDFSERKLFQLFKNREDELKQDIKNTLYSGDTSPKISKVSASSSKLKSRVDEATFKIMYCLQPSVRDKIVVFDLNSDGDLAESILRSICKVQEISSRKIKGEKEIGEKIESLLNLAMDWNCIHIAKDFVFKNSLEKIPNKYDAFLRALKENLPIFVYEFLRLGINVDEVFYSPSHSTRQYEQFIKELYQQDSSGYKCVEDVTSRKKKIIDSIETLNKVLRKLVGDYMHHLYFDNKADRDEYQRKWGLISPNEISMKKRSDSYEKRILSKDELRIYFMRDLFLWAILMNYTDMAKVFLAFMKYRMCPALIASKILREYYSKAAFGKDKEDFEEQRKYFEQYAVDCLDKCDDHDINQAAQLAIKQNELYGYVTCLEVASNAEAKLFLSEPAATEVMRNIWYDKLRPKQTEIFNWITLFLGVLSLGILAPLIVKYQNLVHESKPGESLKPMFESNGINYSDPYAYEYPRCCRANLSLNRYFYRFKNFHSSLLIKYCYHLVSYLFFLLLFSYVLLFAFAPPTKSIPSIDWTEILTIIIVSCMLIEEIHYFFTQDNLTFFGKLKSYFRDLFKIIKTLAFVLFYIGLILRFRRAYDEDEFIAARVVMAYDILLWWIQCISFVIVAPFLGPHLVAIGKMLKDLSFFICVFGVFMIGYGVASRSMVYYPVVNNFTTATGGFIDTTFDGRSVFGQVLYPVYFFLFASPDYDSGYLDMNPDAGWSIATQVLLAAHMMIVNILLINLLIAMFNKRFEQVQEETRQIWHSQQYLFTREYYTRSPFIIPFSLIYNLFYLLRNGFFFLRRECCYLTSDRHPIKFKMIAKNISLANNWREFEGAVTYEYAHNQVKSLMISSSIASDTADVNRATSNDSKTDDSKNGGLDMKDLRNIQDITLKLSATAEQIHVKLRREKDSEDSSS